MFLCHERSSHLADMRLCRHGPRQRRLDRDGSTWRGRRCQAAPIRAGSRSRGGAAAGAQGRGRHFADMERDAGEVRRLRAEKPHHLGR